MKTLVLANQKGGVGKSTVATLLSHYLRRCGQRMLAIDLDHQGNFTDPVRLSKRASVAGLTADRLLTASGADVPSAPFALVPMGDDLLGLERQPEMHAHFARNLRSCLRAMDDRFDVCVIDTHPNPDIRLNSALASADFILSPIQLNHEAIGGVRALLAHPQAGYYKMKALLNPKLKLSGLLPISDALWRRLSRRVPGILRLSPWYCRQIYRQRKDFNEPETGTILAPEFQNYSGS